MKEEKVFQGTLAKVTTKSLKPKFNMIPVTKPFLPPIEEYEALVRGIWQRNWLTNNGPLVNELELKLKQYLGLPNLLYLTNGTIALQIAIKALALKGEIITTAYSFVATTSSIIWEGCEPVMVDIDPKTLNIDPEKIEAAITPRTTAILATHMYGNPCDIDAISEIAQKHNLKVIYDGAHCFGTTYKGKSVFAYGDISATSFHATKLFHTTEGGAVFSENPLLLKKMAYMRNFGIAGQENIACLGINGKNSEFHAAMGIANLKYIDSILEKRKKDFLYYNEQLKDLEKEQPVLADSVGYNYSYYPIILPSEKVLKKMMYKLTQNCIFPRRYFYPSLNTLPFINKFECKHSLNMARQTLCLPLYYELTEKEIRFISAILVRAQKVAI